MLIAIIGIKHLLCCGTKASIERSSACPRLAASCQQHGSWAKSPGLLEQEAAGGEHPAPPPALPSPRAHPPREHRSPPPSAPAKSLWKKPPKCFASWSELGRKSRQQLPTAQGKAAPSSPPLPTQAAAGSIRSSPHVPRSVPRRARAAAGRRSPGMLQPALHSS